MKTAKDLQTELKELKQLLNEAENLVDELEEKFEQLNDKLTQAEIRCKNVEKATEQAMLESSPLEVVKLAPEFSEAKAQFNKIYRAKENVDKQIKLYNIKIEMLKEKINEAETKLEQTVEKDKKEEVPEDKNETFERKDDESSWNNDKAE